SPTSICGGAISEPTIPPRRDFTSGALNLAYLLWPLRCVVAARSPRRQRLFLHDHDQRFILCSAAVDDQRLAVRAGALVAREVDEFGGNGYGFFGPGERGFLVPAFHRPI